MNLLLQLVAVGLVFIGGHLLLWRKSNKEDHDFERSLPFEQDRYPLKRRRQTCAAALKGQTFEPNRQRLINEIETIDKQLAAIDQQEAASRTLDKDYLKRQVAAIGSLACWVIAILLTLTNLL